MTIFLIYNFYTDSILPHVCSTALHASERPVKIAACELLHSLTVYAMIRADRDEKKVEEIFIII